MNGAGVRLRRAFGFGDTRESDPFLLLDDLRNERKADFIRGFPWHPHRGIETIIENTAVPEKVLADGSRIRVIAGEFEGLLGPVEGIVTEPEYFDLHLAPGAGIVHRVAPGKKAFAYVFGGAGRFGEGPKVGDGTIVFFSDGDSIRFRAAPDSEFRFLFCGGMGLGEPVAWRGPIVMNSEEELELAFRQLQSGDFVF